MKRVYEFLWIVFHPSFWEQNNRTCLIWDQWVNDALDRNCSIEVKNKYVAFVDGIAIWTANYPYAFGYMYQGMKVLPKRLTRKRLYDRIIEAQINAAAAKGNAMRNDHGNVL